MLGRVLVASSFAGAPAATAREGDPAAADAPAPPDVDSSSAADTAAALIQQGIELRKAGDDRAALSTFERAYSLGGSARALAQMALAEQALGLWREAHEHLSRALSQAGDAWIEEHRTTLAHAASEIASQLGSLEVSCNVAGAEVLLDGRPLGRTPLLAPLPLVAGANVIQVRSEGHFDFARQVFIDAGRLSRLNVVLTPRPTANAARASAASSASAAPAVSLSPEPLPLAGTAEAKTNPDPSARDALLYTSLGLSALGVSAGVTGYIVREVYVRKYNDDSRCAQLDGAMRMDECSDEYAAYRAGEVAAIAGFSGAAVFGLVAAYLWWGAPPKASETVGFACAVRLGGAGCEGRF